MSKTNTTIYFKKLICSIRRIRLHCLKSPHDFWNAYRCKEVPTLLILSTILRLRTGRARCAEKMTTDTCRTSRVKRGADWWRQEGNGRGEGCRPPGEQKASAGSAGERARSRRARSSGSSLVPRPKSRRRAAAQRREPRDPVEPGRRSGRETQKSIEKNSYIGMKSSPAYPL